jgi:hypothetical protein
MPAPPARQAARSEPLPELPLMFEHDDAPEESPAPEPPAPRAVPGERP